VPVTSNVAPPGTLVISVIVPVIDGFVDGSPELQLITVEAMAIRTTAMAAMTTGRMTRINGSDLLWESPYPAWTRWTRWLRRFAGHVFAPAALGGILRIEKPRRAAAREWRTA
jgi:hypothetical protein